MEEFPCPLERIAASALLLLSSSTATTSPSLSQKFVFEDESIKDGGSNSNSSDSGKRMESVVLSDSKACSSSLSSDGSSEEIQARRLRIVAVVARCHEMKLKVVRKSRSKNYRSCHHREITSGNPAKMASGSVSENTEVSCLSSGSSARSRCTSGGVGIGKTGLSIGDVKRKQLGSAHMRRRAEAILRLLSGGCSSEVRIRRVLGDSPDTSKALRMRSAWLDDLDVCCIKSCDGGNSNADLTVVKAGRSQKNWGRRQAGPLYLHDSLIDLRS